VNLSTRKYERIVRNALKDDKLKIYSSLAVAILIYKEIQEENYLTYDVKNNILEILKWKRKI
jgi:hypothetical protein